jgi:hypothetical protein
MRGSEACKSSQNVIEVKVQETLLNLEAPLPLYEMWNAFCGTLLYVCFMLRSSLPDTLNPEKTYKYFVNSQ